MISRALQAYHRSPGIFHLALIVLVWVVMEVIVNPLGNFPLNDDWAYGYSVQTLVEKGEFRLSDWTATNLLSQALWGCLFCLPFGFSFTALRISTIVLGLIGLLTTYGTLRELECAHGLSFVAVLLLAINPVYFELSNTFMSDVPFFAFAMFSVYFLLRSLKYDSRRDLFLGATFSVLSILTRQIGIVIPFSYGFAYLVKKGTNRWTLINGFWLGLMGVLVQLSYQKWLTLTGKLPYSYGDQIYTIGAEVSRGIPNLIWDGFQIGIFSLTYLSIFVLPLIVIAVLPHLNHFNRRKRIVLFMGVTFVFLLGLAVVLQTGRFMPFLGNILVDTGVGPLGLDNTFQPRVPGIWKIITMIGILMSGFTGACIYRLIRGSLQSKQDWKNTFVLSAIVLNFFPLAVLGLTWRGFYDRYLLFLIPLVSIVIIQFSARATTRKRSAELVGATIIGLYAAFTLASTHDYLSSNRALWAALEQLTHNSNISPERIHGGFEFNGRFLYKEKTWISNEKGKNFSILWKNENADYVMSFEQIEGYRETKRYPFSTWLAPGQWNVLVLQKTSSPKPGPGPVSTSSSAY